MEHNAHKEETAPQSNISEEAISPSEEQIPEQMEQKTGCQRLAVRLRYPGRIANYCECPAHSQRGKEVIVETERGLSMATVLHTDPVANDEDCELPKVQRQANTNDHRTAEKNKSREKEAFSFCASRISTRELPMKLIDVEFIHNGNKAIFYFFSEGRVDFRALVKDLAQRFHTRIEMRQIGVRDGSKILGGIGICGRQLCCNTFLRDFEPVSIRMAKDQNLSLNPQKVSGVCGRLMCCLCYEQKTYMKQRKKLPKIGKIIKTPAGEGKIRDVNVLTQKIKVDLEGQTRDFQIEDDGKIIEIEKQIVSISPKESVIPPANAELKTALSSGFQDEREKEQVKKNKKRRRRRKPNKSRTDKPNNEAKAQSGKATQKDNRSKTKLQAEQREKQGTATAQTQAGNNKPKSNSPANKRRPRGPSSGRHKRNRKPNPEKK